MIILAVSWAMLLLNTLNAQTPNIKWWFDTKDASFGQSAAADIDGDGKLEIVFGCYRNDSCIYALNGEDGSLLWKFNAHGWGEGCNDVAPVIYDVDGDDSLEVIVASSCNPKTFCFNGNTGAIEWEIDTRGSDSPPTVVDLDGDSLPEILHGEFGGYVICINGEDGSFAWEIAVDTNSWIQTAPTIVDLNADGQLDFVVATWNNVNEVDNKIYAYNGANHSLMWSYPTRDYIYHGSTVGDLDHDGKPELVLGCYNDTLYCINGEDGSTAWKYMWGTSYYMGAPATIADLNGDGWCEVIFSAWFKVGALSHDGNLLWSYSIPNYEQAFRGVALSDISGDDSLDVVFGTDGGNVIALRGSDGTHLWTKNLMVHYGDSLFALDNAPLIADFNGDDSLDVFIVGGHAEYPAFQNDFGRAYMMTVGKGSGPDWLMFQRDIWRQSSMCGDGLNTSVEGSRDEFIMNIYPNPGDKEVNCRFSNRRNEPYSLVIYNGIGQVVERVNSIEGEELTIDTSNWQRGFYFFQLLNRGIMVGQKGFVRE